MVASTVRVFGRSFLVEQLLGTVGLGPTRRPFVFFVRWGVDMKWPESRRSSVLPFMVPSVKTMQALKSK